MRNRDGYTHSAAVHGVPCLAGLVVAMRGSLLSLVLPSTWHTARVASDHDGTAPTGIMGVHALPCGLDYVIISLSVSCAAMVSQMS